jgi:type I restriction enzyme S subunit
LVDCTIDGNISYGIVQPGEHVEGGVPIIRVNNVNNGQLQLKDILKVSPDVEEKYKRTRLKGGEVLLTLVGSTGQSFVAPKELNGWNVPRAIAVIRPKSEIGADWLNICLQSKSAQHFLDVRANTTVQKTLNLKDVRDIPIPIPPPPIKEQIESIAVSLQKKIKLNRQINQTLEEMAQAIFKSWFVDFEPVKAKIEAKANGQDPERAAMCAISGKSDAELDHLPPDQLAQLRVTAALFPNELIDSELGPIPKGWTVRNVENIVTRLKPKQRYSKKQVFAYGAIPVLEQGASILLGYHNEEPGFIASPKKPLFIFGDHTCVCYLSCGPFDISQNVIPLSGNSHPTVWVYYAVKDKQTFQEYRRHWSEFKIKQVVVPSNALCNVFSDIATKLYQKKERSIEENNSLAQIRDTLLPKLLSGEIELSQVA